MGCTPSPAARFLALVAGLCLLASGLFGFEAKTLYARVSSQVVYLRHELLIDAARSKVPELWQRFEERTKVPFLGAALPLASGSGFFLDDAGRLITSRHVVQAGDEDSLRTEALALVGRLLEASDSPFSPQEVARLRTDLKTLVRTGTYRFSATQGNRVLGSVSILALGSVKDPDLALLEVPGIQSVPLGLMPDDQMGEALLGADVASFGYPLGTTLDEMFRERVVTMNRGGISAFRAGEALDLQHTAAISRGNSGGPLVNSQGVAVGVNTAVIEGGQANSLYYAVSSRQIRTFLVAKGWGNLALWNNRLARMGAPEVWGPLTKVDLRSSPPGAVVTADGRTLGTTPVSVLLPPGPYVLTLRKPGVAFETLDLVLTEGASSSREVPGVSGVLVHLQAPGVLAGAGLEFASSRGRYRYEAPEEVVLPPGDYQLTVSGVPGLSGVLVPVTVGEGPTTVDLGPWFKTATLAVRGVGPGAEVWVDGQERPDGASGRLVLPLGVHTVAVRQPGYQPLFPTRVTVRDDLVSFVVWKPQEGFDQWRDRAAWGSLVLGGLGLGSTVLGGVLGSDAFAVPSTSSYTAYRDQKQNMGMVVATGVGLLAVAGGLGLWTWYLDGCYQSQVKDFHP